MSDDNERTSRINRAKDEASAIAVAETNNAQVWSAYNSGLDRIHADFDTILDESLDKLLERRREEGRGANVLYLAGQAGLLRQLPLQHGLAVTLGDSRTSEQKEEDSARGISVYAWSEELGTTGNVLDSSTWKDINSWVRERNIEGFDLEICNPWGGFKLIPEDPRLVFTLVNKMWRLLSKDEGVLLTQYQGVHGDDIKRWAELLKKNNISVWLSGIGDLRLHKYPDSPEDLPYLSEYKRLG